MSAYELVPLYDNPRPQSPPPQQQQRAIAHQDLYWDKQDDYHEIRSVKSDGTSSGDRYARLRSRMTMENHAGFQARHSRHALPTRLEKMYMGVAAFEAITITAIAFAVFGLVQENITSQNSKVRTVPVYLAVFCLAQIFSVLYIFDGLRARNIVQLGFHLIFNVCMLTYSILQIPQTKDALSSETSPGACGRFERCTGPNSLYDLLEKLMIVPPIIFGLCTVIFAVMLPFVFKQFGWAVFRLVGASPELKKAHRHYQMMIALLKMLLFFGTAFCVAMLILVTAWDRNRAEFIITVVALPLVVIFMFICGWALRKENKYLMSGCLVLMVAGIVYFIYKLSTLWLPRTQGLYKNTRITMAIFSIFSVMILLATFALGLVCVADFGKGLIEAHRNPENRTSLWSLPANARYEKELEHNERDREAKGYGYSHGQNHGLGLGLGIDAPGKLTRGESDMDGYTERNDLGRAETGDRLVID